MGDVWADLLEPYLDTEVGEAAQAATLARLAAVGLNAHEVARIRARVGPMMAHYNSRYWDWVHLGLSDLLDAARAEWIPEELRRQAMADGDFEQWAARIAEMGA